MHLLFLGRAQFALVMSHATLSLDMWCITAAQINHCREFLLYCKDCHILSMHAKFTSLSTCLCEGTFSARCILPQSHAVKYSYFVLPSYATFVVPRRVHCDELWGELLLSDLRNRRELSGRWAKKSLIFGADAIVLTSNYFFCWFQTDRRATCHVRDAAWTWTRKGWAMERTQRNCV